MSRLWSFSELMDQCSARMQRAWSGSQSAMTPQAILFGLTLAFLSLSVALESLLLFLLAVVQGLVILQVRHGQPKVVTWETSATATATLTGLRAHLPTLSAVHRIGCQIATILYRILYRLTASLIVSLTAGLATLSTFVLNQAELWQWTILQTAGPPLGAVLVTGLVVLLVLLISGWLACRRPLLPR